jgi:hypothetical protein
LFLGGRDQPEIMLGVLIVIFGCYGVAGTSRIAGQLDVFFRDVGGGAANLDIGSVGLENPGHRVLATPVIVAIVIISVVSVTHPLVVVILTVSHVLPSYRSQIVVVIIAAPEAGRATRSRIAMQFNAASILPYVAFNKDAFPNRQGIVLAGPNHSARRRSKLRFSRVNFQAQ